MVYSLAQLARLGANVPSGQFAYPVSDISAGTWTPSTGVDLYPMLADASDATYIRSSSSLDTGLVAYWPLNEGSGSTSTDASGNGHTVTLVNATWDTSGLKKFGAAALKHSAVSTGNRGASFTAINLGTTHSIAFWINGWAGSNDGIVLGGATTGNYAGYIDATDIYYSAGTGNFCNRTHGGLTGSHHIALVRDGTTSVTFYKDGVALGSSDLASSNADLTITTLLSYETDLAGGDFYVINATVDDVRLYSSALTSTQVGLLYRMIPGSAVAEVALTPLSTPGPGTVTLHVRHRAV